LAAPEWLFVPREERDLRTQSGPSKPEVLAIIPARGGSKGIPRKNVLALAGKPLIARTIEQAKASGIVTRVVVSTDDEEISQVSLSCGAEVVRRPAEISGDEASSEAALLHVLEHLRETEGYRPDLLVFLQCTSPLTLAEDIDGTVEALRRQEADTALAVSPFHYFLWKTGPNGHAAGINHDPSVRLLRQQREAQFIETGAVYVMRTDGFLRHGHRFFGRTVLHEIPIERRLEIDEPVDFQIADLLLKRRERAEKTRSLPQPVKALVMDFDGVFTDNKVVVLPDSREAVLCNRADGMGIRLLREVGLPMLVLSTEQDPVCHARCRKLQLDCLNAVQDKAPVLRDWAADRGIALDKTVYLGNDVNDLECMAIVGCPAAVSDAHPAARKAARIVLSARGGHGAVREIADLILSQTGDGQ